MLVIHPGLCINQSWGLRHPYIDRSDTRVPWTDDERDVIGAFLDNYTGAYKWAACLAHIQSSNDEIRALFHPNHVRNSTLIRGALRTRASV